MNTVKSIELYVDVLSTVLFELYVNNGLESKEFSLFGHCDVVQERDEWLEIYSEFLDCMSPEERKQYWNEQLEIEACYRDLLIQRVV